MRKQLFYPLMLLFIFSFGMQAQSEEFYMKEITEGEYTALSFSGFRVELIPSSTFKIVFNNDSCLKKQMVTDGQLSVLIVDQTGQVPKETVQVYINDPVSDLSIHNGELVMNDYWVTDSLNVNFAAAGGTLKVQTEKLYITAGGGIGCKVEGTTDYFYAHQGGGSTITHNQLKCDHKEIKITRHF